VSGKLCRADESFKEIIVENTWKHSIYGLPHWKEYKFSDVVDIIGGSQPPKSEFRSEYQEGYIRLIQIRDYKSDSHIVYIPKEKARRFVSATDVMIGRYGPPIFQILRGLEDAYNVALMKAEPKDNLIDQEYLYWYLQNYKIYNYIEAGSDRTAGQSGVNKKHLEAYPILLPSIEEQQNIVKEIVKLTTLANRIEETLQLAEKRVNLLTQSILAKAFSGELTAEWREQHQELITGINSAKSLLAKIQAEREASKPVKKAKKVK
jgi:type I restriction enzyme S subunit